MVRESSVAGPGRRDRRPTPAGDRTGRPLLVEPVGRVDLAGGLVELGPPRAGLAGRHGRLLRAFVPVAAAASGAPSQWASASIALSASRYASTDAAMMLVPRASPSYSPVPRAPPTSGGATRTVTTPTVSAPSPSAWMS